MEAHEKRYTYITQKLVKHGARMKLLEDDCNERKIGPFQTSEHDLNHCPTPFVDRLILSRYNAAKKGVKKYGTMYRDELASNPDSNIGKYLEAAKQKKLESLTRCTIL